MKNADDAATVADIAGKAFNYIKEHYTEMEDQPLVKYATSGVMAIMGMRRGGFIGAIMLAAAIVMVVRYLNADNDKPVSKLKKAIAK